MPNPNPAQHTAQGIQRHQNTDYDALEMLLHEEACELNTNNLAELVYQAKVLRARQGGLPVPVRDEQPEPTVAGHARRMAPHGQSETFQSLCEQSKNPIPIKQPMGGVAITNWIDGLTLSQLCSVADRYDIPHNVSVLIDDDYPDKTDKLRAAVAEAMEKVEK